MLASQPLIPMVHRLQLFGSQVLLCALSYGQARDLHHAKSIRAFFHILFLPSTGFV
jgi:hypothetical protein